MLDEFRTISWFSRVGKPIDLDRQRLIAWEDWPGPEDQRVASLHLRQQTLYDQIVANDSEAGTLFDSVRDEVITTAALAVSYSPTSDAWDPESLAVWHAGWTAALVACCRKSGVALPRDLAEQWLWFSAGHWPCAFATEPPEANNYECIVL